MRVTQSREYNLNATKVIIMAMLIDEMMRTVSAREGGLSKLDITPAGGAKAGSFCGSIIDAMGPVEGTEYARGGQGFKFFPWYIGK